MVLELAAVAADSVLPGWEHRLVLDVELVLVTEPDPGSAQEPVLPVQQVVLASAGELDVETLVRFVVADSIRWPGSAAGPSVRAEGLVLGQVEIWVHS